MGQNTFECISKSTPSEDILNRQIKIYKWRADPKFNSFIARVSFKNAFTLKQQQQFAEFMKRQEKNQYLQIYKFREKQRYCSSLEEEEVIGFEKYRCNLMELRNALSLQETIYTLHSLLIGFQEIRRVMGKIIVDPECCFITTDGQVRAWINQNPKMNQVYSCHNRQIMPEGRPAIIIKRIIDMSEKIGQKSKKMMHFSSFLKGALNKLSQKNNNFAQIRKIINQYCFNSNIHVNSSISRAFQFIGRTNSAKQIKNSWIRQQRMTEPYKDTKDTNTYLSTIESEAKHFFQIQPQTQRKYPINSFIFKKEEYQGQQSSIIEAKNKQNRLDLVSSVLPFASQIIAKVQKPVKQPHAHIHWQKQSRTNSISQSCSNQNMNQPISNRISTHICSQVDQSGIISAKVDGVHSIHNQSKNSQCNYQQSKYLSFQNSMINITLMPDKVSPQKTSRSPKKQQKQNEKRKPMLGSAMTRKSRSFIPDAIAKSALNYKTAMKRDSIKGNQGVEFRSWITSKTITKLISEKEDEEMMHSSGDSSDYYNGSVYSGVLLQMGHDVMPNQQSYPKTVKIWKQI